MDTSEEYIKMSDCEEIQKEHKPREGDYYFLCGECKCLEARELDKPFVWVNREPSDYRIHWKGDIWLPRQDQLQEMVRRYSSDSDHLWILFNGIYDFGIDSIYSRHIRSRYANQFTSMEQLWLAFVMKELHDKVWDGERWG